MIALIWIIEIINIVVSAAEVDRLYQIGSQANSVLSGLGDSFERIANMYILNIFVTLVFCIAITVVYSRAQNNKDIIHKVIDYLDRKRKSERKKANDNSQNVIQGGISQNVTAESEVEKELFDTNYEASSDNTAFLEHEECPNCCRIVSESDNFCPNCGTKIER